MGIDMIFSEDAILISLLERSDSEDEMKEAVLCYLNRGKQMEQSEEKAETNDLDMVHKMIVNWGCRLRVRLTVHWTSRKRRE